MATTPLVNWPLPPARAAEPPTEVQVYAIAIGACVPALLASATWWLHFEWIAVIAALGILIGPVLAVVEAGRMLAPSGAEGVLRAAFAAPIAPDVIVGILAFALFVMVVALVVGTPITLPTAFVVAWLLRRAARMDRRRARLHIAALVATALVAGAITLYAMAADGGLLSGGWTG